MVVKPAAPPRAEEKREIPRRDARKDPVAPDRVALPRPEAIRAALPRSELERAEAARPEVTRPIRRRDVPHEPINVPEGLRTLRLVPGTGRPRYPSGCRSGEHRRGGCEGRGEYYLEVDERGRVVTARTVRSAGCRHLDESTVLFMLHRARFVPAEIDGRPVPWSGSRCVVFRLEDVATGASR